MLITSEDNLQKRLEAQGMALMKIMREVGYAVPTFGQIEMIVKNNKPVGFNSHHHMVRFKSTKKDEERNV